MERVDLGRDRAAHRVVLRLAGGATVLVAVTHLHHPPEAHAERLEQVERLLAWLEAGPPTDGRIVMGDFNADPREPTYARMIAASYRSAYAEANSAEPAVTWPSGLVAPAMDTDGDPDCLDYIWLGGAVQAAACRLAFDRPAVGDPTLYPSDHVGIAARLAVG